MIGQELTIWRQVYTIYKIENERMTLIEAKTGDLKKRLIEDIIRDVISEVQHQQISMGEGNKIIRALRKEQYKGRK